MELEIRKIIRAMDYPTLEMWWKERGAGCPEEKNLPPTGFIVDSPHGGSVCAGFLFKTDANIAVIGHVVSSPGYHEKSLRSKAIDLLISKLISEAALSGFEIVTASSNVERLNKRYENLGFIKTDENETHYGRIL